MNVRRRMRKLTAFVRRDFLSEISYRFSFFLQLGGILLSVVTWFFIARLFGGVVVEGLVPYGGSYFAFVIVGVAFSNYLQTSLFGLSRNIRDAQMMGTLEALLVTQTGPPLIILASSLYGFCVTSLRVVVYLVFGALLFGLDLGQANYLGALLMLALTIVAFMSLGILSASFIMVFKKGDPVGALIMGLSWFIGGVYYPTSVLPDFLRKLGYLLPITHSLEGIRLTLLQGQSIAEVGGSLAALALFCLVMIPLSLLAFRFAVNRAKRDGTLTQY